MESATYEYNYDATASAADAEAAAAAASMMSGVVLLVVLPLIIIAIVAMWKLFTKAGKPGWAALIPIYNTYVMLQIVGRPGWWLLLFFIPFVNIVATIIIGLDMAKVFGKDAMFGILGNVLFNPIGYLILAFGSAQYLGPIAGQPSSGSGPAAPTPPQTPPTQPAPPVPPATPGSTPPQTPPAGSL